MKYPPLGAVVIFRSEIFAATIARWLSFKCFAGKLFLCRHCYQLPYRSQMDGQIDRLISQKHKLGNKIFENYDGYRKRKGMRLKTLDRLLNRYLELEDRIDASMYGRYLALQNEGL